VGIHVEGHSPLGRASSGFQWPWNIATMASVVVVGRAEKSSYGSAKQVIRDPYVLKGIIVR